MKGAGTSADPVRDPFRERAARPLRWRTRVLGAACEFTSNSRELLDLAREAFASVPGHHWRRGPAGRTLRVSLELTRATSRGNSPLPPRPVLSSGAGLLCGHIDAHNHAIVDVRNARALVRVGRAALKHRRLVRYELIEFAAVTLATRVQGLVPLHAGCVGAGGRGVLLLGASGAGKSTLALHSALAGLDFLAEDSVFVRPSTLRATGLSAYAHACADSLPLIADRRQRAAVRRAPRIRRRSGVRKHEVDLRRIARLAPRPLRIVAVLALSARTGRGAAALAPLKPAQFKRLLRAGQAYAAAQPGWQRFERELLRVPARQLGRVTPGQGVAALRELLGARA